MQPVSPIGLHRCENTKACAFDSSDPLNFAMAPALKRGAIGGVAMVMLLSLSLPGLSAPPQNEKLSNRLSNIELCNGADRSSPEPQIKGCTALIETEKETTLVLAIATTIAATPIPRRATMTGPSRTIMNQ